MKRGVFINQIRANCSIYESGLMIYDVLKESKEYSIDYIETDFRLNQFKRMAKQPYDFHIVNWHPYTLAIGQNEIIGLRNRIAIVLEVGPNEYTPVTPAFFDAYAIIDPTKGRRDTCFPLPRPVLPAPGKPLLDNKKLVLGSFGLFSQQFSHEKKFEEIVDQANKSGRESIVRINLPIPNYTSTPLPVIRKYGDWLKSLAKSNVEVIVTHKYMTRNELVGWLSEHTMNCFPYYRDRAGLSAVTDQAVAAGRAVMTTECNTFRHVHKYISHYPKQSYPELAESTLAGVKQMQQDWSPANFRLHFDNMLVEMRMI